MKNSPSILFMGTPYFAAIALTGLITADFNVVGLITQPDKPSGRGSSNKVGPCRTQGPTLLEAQKHDIPVFQPETKEELAEIVEKLNPEIIVVAAYGMIVPQTVLDVPKYGALNIHGSLLPKYRGASPISEAILSGDTNTGITIMKMNIGMDEGPIISSFEFRVSNDLTTASLTEKLAELGAKAIVETIPRWVSGELKETPQDESAATYCKKITKENGHIDWNEPAEIIERKVRAYYPWPTAYTFVDEKRIKIVKASSIQRPASSTTFGNLEFDSGHIYVPTSEGTLEILELQLEGKKLMSATDFINGNKGLDGSRLE